MEKAGKLPGISKGCRSLIFVAKNLWLGQPVCEMPGLFSRVFVFICLLLLYIYFFYPGVLYNLENENELLASIDIGHPLRNSTNNTMIESEVNLGRDWSTQGVERNTRLQARLHVKREGTARLETSTGSRRNLPFFT